MYNKNPSTSSTHSPSVFVLLYLYFLVCATIRILGYTFWKIKAYTKAATEVAAKTRQEGLPYADYVLPVSYAIVTELFESTAVVMAKILSELLTLWITGTDAWFGGDAWFTWATLVSVSLYRMNESLRLYDPLFIIPLLHVNFIFFAIISGESLFFGLMNYAKKCSHHASSMTNTSLSRKQADFSTYLCHWLCAPIQMFFVP